MQNADAVSELPAFAAKSRSLHSVFARPGGLAYIPKQGRLLDNATLMNRDLRRFNIKVTLSS